MSEVAKISLSQILARNGVPVGGTTGQVLAKSSNTPYKLKWIDLPSGGGSSETPLIDCTQRVITSSSVFGVGSIASSSVAFQLDVNFPTDNTFYPEDYGTLAYEITDVKILTTDKYAVPVAYAINGVGYDESAQTLFTSIQCTKYKNIDYSSFTDSPTDLKVVATITQVGAYSN